MDSSQLNEKYMTMAEVGAEFEVCYVRIDQGNALQLARTVLCLERVESKGQVVRVTYAFDGIAGNNNERDIIHAEGIQINQANEAAHGQFPIVVMDAQDGHVFFSCEKVTDITPNEYRNG